MRAAAGLRKTGRKCSKRWEISGIALWQRPRGKKTKCRAASDPELSSAEPVDSGVAAATALSHPASPPRAAGIRPSRKQRQKGGQRCSWSAPRRRQEEPEVSSQTSLQSREWELPVEMCLHPRICTALRSAAPTHPAWRGP